MENNISNFSGGGSRILRELFKGKLVSEAANDYILPEYLPDTERILLCTVSPKLDGYFINDGVLEIEGTVKLFLLLGSEDNSLSSVSYSEPFEVKTVIDGLYEDSPVMLRPEMEYQTARLVNPRKLGVKYQVNVGIAAFSETSAELSLSGTESLEDDMRLKRRYNTVSTAEIAFVREKEIPVSQDIELDGSCPRAEEIISVQIRMIPSEIRSQGEETEVRSDVFANIIYRTDEGSFFSADRKFSVSKILQASFAPAYEKSAMVTSNGVSAKISPNSYGEMKVIELDLTYDIELYSIGNREAVTVSDAYSTEYECSCTSEEKKITVFKRSFASNLSVNASVERSEISAGDVKTVFNGTASVKNAASSYDGEKRKLVTEGVLSVTLVCESKGDDDESPRFTRSAFDYPFKCETDVKEPLSGSELALDCTVGEMRFRADSQKLYADVELFMKITATDKVNTAFISSVTLDKASPIDRSGAPITLSYPSESDSLWDIAKYYSTDFESIMAANGLTSDSIEGKKVLLIPKKGNYGSAVSKAV